MASPTESSQWPLLHEDLLHEITKRLLKPSDYVRFGAVCKGWHSFAHKSYKQKHLLHVHQNFPLLLIPTEDQEGRSLYNITEGMVYHQFQLNLPNKRCCGSSYGWLFFVDKVTKSTLELILINPFLGDSKTIKLPPINLNNDDIQDMMDHYGVHKAILSKDPYVSPHDYEVVALYGSLAKLAYYKYGDKYWSYAKKAKVKILADVIFYKDLILALDRYDWIISFTLEPKARIQRTNCSLWYLKCNTLMIRPRTIRNYACNAYLVENSNRDLLLARRFYWGESFIQARETAQQLNAARIQDIAEGGSGIAFLEEYKKIEENMYREEEDPKLTVNFEVYRLSFSWDGKRLIKKIRIKTLDGEILFLGDNNSISVSASKHLKLHSNSIYYTDDYDNYCDLPFGSIDNGIFDVENESFDRHYLPSFSIKDLPPPIFVVPK
ncbi:putative F-box domain-containing protein [Lupinus albus]|uniref:Putative F-box domain-containing protein n=1 Tax=Lupinus albus TaxID=3870 RepID=A0A6A4PTC0_LUPAL|nr:putative F-box domain-containing protein [Lupinus albus]